jgi:Zn-finger nucleic acid-binding protein
MPDLVCPKCQSPMRSYERNGVTVDQCTGCRGVFLDRGELERLVDAEGQFYERSGGDAPPPPPAREPEYRRHDDDDDDDWRRHGGHGHGGHPGHRKRKKKGFLDDIFDFG